MTRLCFAVALAALAAGCESTITASGVVMAPPDVRALVSRTEPAYLYLEIVYSGGRQEKSLVSC